MATPQHGHAPRRPRPKRAHAPQATPQHGHSPIMPRPHVPVPAGHTSQARPPLPRTATPPRPRPHVCGGCRPEAPGGAPVRGKLARPRPPSAGSSPDVSPKSLRLGPHGWRQRRRNERSRFPRLPSRPDAGMTAIQVPAGCTCAPRAGRAAYLRPPGRCASPQLPGHVTHWPCGLSPHTCSPEGSPHPRPENLSGWFLTYTPHFFILT